ncbi:TPA: DUF637 domain-containing protein [Serratia marcescens]|nr:DUF637 domain-containing protein [Serratia marcescens]HEJ6927428.1 DUF637 domain-containing protein [Serratia marcescens]HEJ7075428.1 DUF637 domain-containing protein [Serratia marcescens]HEJ7119858.1 DUF637 domain-containing protein [Serratia marcescens]HEJ7197164.1 DUF637 domain-containing protein [Serratia marcescens]
MGRGGQTVQSKQRQTAAAEQRRLEQGGAGVAGQSVISSSLNTAINGGSFKDNLTNALLANIGSQVQAEGANLIADNGQVLDKNS